MKHHGDQFDDHLVRQTRDAACGLPPGGTATKIDRGEANRGAALVSQDIRDQFAARWEATMTREFGLASYHELTLEMSK